MLTLITIIFQFLLSERHFSNLYVFFMLLKLFMAFFRSFMAFLGSKTKYGPQMLSLFLC